MPVFRLFYNGAKASAAAGGKAEVYLEYRVDGMAGWNYYQSYAL
jgi:hypothetical protein